LIEIKRIELVNTADMSVFTSEYFKPKDGNRIRYHRSLRAIVERMNDVRIVQFTAGSMMHTEGFSPYCVTGESESDVGAWTRENGAPMNQDFTLPVWATVDDGSVTEKVVYLHFKSV
jgi:hypothetical protein